MDAQPRKDDAKPVSRAGWFRVIALTAVPSSLLLSVTNYILTDIASLPLFWIVQLEPLVATSDQERAARQAHLQQAVPDFDALPFDDSAARAFGRVAASLRQSVRKATARSYFAMIAATALAHALLVYTCDPDDFTGIAVLEVVAVPVPSR